MSRKRKKPEMTDPVMNDDEVGVEDEILDAEAPNDPPEAEQALEPDEDLVASGDDGVAETGDGPAGGHAPGGDFVAAGDPSDDAELDTLRRDFSNLNDRHLRLAAEFNNFRRRTEQERLSAWARAQADLVGRFVDVLDDLHRVAELDLSNATVDGIMEGIDLVEKKFLRVISDVGVEMIDPVGESFDPEMMEAMMRSPAESDDQVDTVAQVFQKGYSLKGILVRPARVSVYTQG